MNLRTSFWIKTYLMNFLKMMQKPGKNWEDTYYVLYLLQLDEISKIEAKRFIKLGAYFQLSRNFLCVK